MIADKNKSKSAVNRYNAPGVYKFSLKTDCTVIYCGKAQNLNTDIMTMMECLFSKNILDLSPLEVQLKKHDSAADWSVSMFICQVDTVNVELAKRIIEFETLYPMGLNKN